MDGRSGASLMGSWAYYPGLLERSGGMGEVLYLELFVGNQLVPRLGTWARVGVMDSAAVLDCSVLGGSSEGIFLRTLDILVVLCSNKWKQQEK